MITMHVWVLAVLAAGVPGAATAGLMTGLWLRRGDAVDAWRDGYLTGCIASQAPGPSGDLLSELPDWDDDTLAQLREEGPGEITGPFLITDLPAPGPASVDPRHDRGGEHHERVGTLAEEEAAARALVLAHEFESWEGEMTGLIVPAYEALGFDLPAPMQVRVALT